MQENLFPLKISIFYDFVKPSASAESEQPLNEQKKKKRKREKDFQPFWLQINPQMWAECNWCCAGFLPLWQPETKAWTCTKSTALVKAPAALSGMLSDNLSLPPLQFHLIRRSVSWRGARVLWQRRVLAGKGGQREEGGWGRCLKDIAISSPSWLPWVSLCGGSLLHGSTGSLEGTQG